MIPAILFAIAFTIIVVIVIPLIIKKYRYKLEENNENDSNGKKKNNILNIIVTLIVIIIGIIIALGFYGKNQTIGWGTPFIVEKSRFEEKMQFASRISMDEFVKESCDTFLDEAILRSEIFIHSFFGIYVIKENKTGITMAFRSRSVYVFFSNPF